MSKRDHVNVDTSKTGKVIILTMLKKNARFMNSLHFFIQGCKGFRGVVLHIACKASKTALKAT